MSVMTFRLGHVDFRWDTIANTVLICITLIIGFWILHHQLVQNARENAKAANRMVSAAQDVSKTIKGVGSQDVVLLRLENEHLALSKKLDDNSKEIAALMKELRERRLK